MSENITVAILVIIILSAGIWSWWFTNQDSDSELSSKEENADE